jgi:predicted metal-dependent hydrolase
MIVGVGLGLFFLVKSKTYESFQYDSKSEIIIKKIKQNIIKLFYKKKFSGVLKILNSKNILDYIYIQYGPQSFTINKKNISLCLKNNKTGIYYDENSLMYVVLHELAHVICPDIGHTDRFKIIFDALLKHAERNNMYHPNIPFVENYCPS